MRIFKDNTGDEWQIEIDFAAIPRIRGASGGEWNLGEIAATYKACCGSDPSGFAVWWKLLWFIVEPQAIARGIDCQAFAKSMAAEGGILLAVARREFWFEWARFLLPYRPREARMLQRAAKAQHEAIKRARKERVNHGRTK